MEFPKKLEEYLNHLPKNTDAEINLWTVKVQVMHLLWDHYKKNGGFTGTAAGFINELMATNIWPYNDLVAELEKEITELKQENVILKKELEKLKAK